MKSMGLGIFLLILGLGLASFGAFSIYKAQKTDAVSEIKEEPENTEEEPGNKEEIPESEQLAESQSDENKQKGNNFETYVINRFSDKYFTLISSADDVRHQSTFSERSLQPDLHFRFTLREEQKEFWVECKFSSNFYKGGFSFSNEKQLERYKAFSAEHNTPVYVVVGIGGEDGTNPKEIYILNVNSIQDSFIDQEDLASYKRKSVHTNFFFDAKNEVLK